MPEREEPILDTFALGTLPAMPTWRVTIHDARDASERRGTYVRANTAGEAAVRFVLHEGMRKYVRVDVQQWQDEHGKPTPRRMQSAESYIAGSRCPPMTDRR